MGVQPPGDFVPESGEHQPDRAGPRVRTGARSAKPFRNTWHRRDGTIERPDDLPDHDFRRIADQRIPATHPAPAREKSRVLEGEQDLLEKLDGDLPLIAE